MLFHVVVPTVGAVVVPLHPTDWIVPALTQPGTLALVPDVPDEPLVPDAPFKLTVQGLCNPEPTAFTAVNPNSPVLLV